MDDKCHWPYKKLHYDMEIYIKEGVDAHGHTYTIYNTNKLVFVTWSTRRYYRITCFSKGIQTYF